MRTSLTTTIEIDLDVHCAIEARRKNFGQTQNDILRQVFQLKNRRERRTRRTGEFAFRLRGKRETKAKNLKETYLGCLRALAKLQPGFLEELSRRSTRARRIVARKPENLFIKSPQLAPKFAARLCGDWWVDTNLSEPQCEQRLKWACDVAQITYGQDLIVKFPPPPANG